MIRHQPRAPIGQMRMLYSAQVCAILGVSRATLARWQRDGRFPARRQVGPGRAGWPEAVIARWIEQLPPAPGTAEARAAQAEARS
jgi:prophage regulatory protein